MYKKLPLVHFFFARALVRPILWCRDLFYLVTLNFYAPLATFTRQCMYDLVISGGEEEIEKYDCRLTFMQTLPRHVFRFLQTKPDHLLMRI